MSDDKKEDRQRREPERHMRYMGVRPPPPSRVGNSVGVRQPRKPDRNEDKPPSPPDKEK